MGIDIEGYEELTREAVRWFWQSRDRAISEQQARGIVSEPGNRGAVTHGKSMNGFVKLFKEIATRNGLADSAMYSCLERDAARQRLVTLPGFYRPTKDWDLVIMSGDLLVAAIEFKSHIGSLGNNFNNRCEEAIGTSTDLWVAFREGAFKPSPRPFVGYLMLLEDAPAVHTVREKYRTHFDVLPEFINTSYAQRYDLFCRKLMAERLFDNATLLLSPRDSGMTGAYSEYSEETNMKRFVAAFAGHVAQVVALQG